MADPTDSDFDPDKFFGPLPTKQADTSDFNPDEFFGPLPDAGHTTPITPTLPTTQALAPPAPVVAPLQQPKAEETPIVPPSVIPTQHNIIQQQLGANEAETASKVRSFLGGLTNNIAPYALAGIDALTGKVPFEVGLHQWNDLYNHAQEDHPLIHMGGGGVMFTALPLAKLGLIANMGVGAAASGLSEWLGSEMKAGWKQVAKQAEIGGLTVMGFHSAGALAKAAGQTKIGEEIINKLTGFLPKPLPMAPDAVVDFHNSLNMMEVPTTKWASQNAAPEPIKLGPLGETRLAQNAEGAKAVGGKTMEKWGQPKAAIPNKPTDPEGKYNLAMVLSKISHSPNEVPTYAVDSLKDLHPVGPVATVSALPDGNYKVTLHEVSGKGVGIYTETFETPSDAMKFKKQLFAQHPEMSFGPDVEAMQVLAGDEPMWDAIFNKPKEAVAHVTTYKKPGPGGTASMKAPVTIGDEAPGGIPKPGPALASVSEDGFLQLHTLDNNKSPYEAQVASLKGRNILAFDTPKGVRYGRELGAADDGHTIVTPFDVEEGIPTINMVSRVPMKNARVPTDKELHKLVRSAEENRAAAKPLDTSNPDLHRFGSEPSSTGATDTSYGLYYGTKGPQHSYAIGPGGKKRPLLTGKATGQKTFDAGDKDWPAIEALRKLEPKLYEKLTGYNSKFSTPIYDLAQEKTHYINYLKENYPKIDISYHKQGETLLEVIGAQVAKAHGYDSLKGAPNQYVALKSSAVDYLAQNKALKGMEPGDVHVTPPPNVAEAPGALNYDEPDFYHAVDTSGPPVVPPAPPPSNIPEAMPPTPPPGQPPPPSDLSTWNVVAATKKSLGSLYEKLRRELVPEHLRADFELGNLISDKQSINSMVSSQTSFQKALERGLGFNKQRINEFRVALYDWAQGKVDDATMAKDFPQAWNEKRSMLKDWQIQRDKLHEDIVALGGISEKENEDYVLLNKYVTRSYALHTMPANKRLELVLKDQSAIAEAVTGFQDWSKSKGKTLSKADAYAKIIDVLGDDEKATALFGEDGGGKPSPNDNLRLKLDLPPWYRNLLGENRDGFYGMSRTLATQKAVRANLQIWEKIAENPLWSRDTMEGLTPDQIKGWTQLGDNPRWFGKASGKFVTKEVYDSLVTLSNATYEGNKVAAGIIKIQKANWFSLGRMRTYMATFMDNWAYSAMAGGVDMSRPIASVNAMVYINKAMLAYRKNPFAVNDELVKFIEDARRIGVDAPGHIGTDLSSQARRQEQYFLEKMAKMEGTNSYSNWFNNFSDVASSITKPGSWMFETADRWHKLASWKMLTDDFMAGVDVGSWKTGLTPVETGKGMAREEAMRRAARQIFNYFPMYDRAAPAAKWMSKSAAGLAAPTAMFAMERNRVYGSIPFRLLDDPGLKFRMLKWGAIGGGMFEANSAIRTLCGNVTDEDIAAAYQERGMSQKKFQPGLWILPCRIGGRIVPIDLTQSAGPLQYLQGDPDLGPLSKALITATMAPIAQGATGAVAEGFMNAGGIQAGFQERKPLPGTNPYVNVAQRFVDRGGVPAIIPETYNNLASTGMLGSQSRNAETAPMWMSIARELGVPVSLPISAGEKSNPSFRASAGADIAEIKAMRGAIVKAAMMKPDQRVGLIQAIVNALSENPTPEKNKIIEGAKVEMKKAALEAQTTVKMEKAAKTSHRPITGDGSTGMTPRRIGVDTK